MPSGPQSGLTLAQLRSRVKDQATFSETDAVIDQWLNEKHKQLIVESDWDTRIASLGTTVAAQTDYDLPADVVEIEGLTVDGSEFEAVGIHMLWLLRKGNATV